jgi:hypothetical protein
VRTLAAGRTFGVIHDDAPVDKLAGIKLPGGRLPLVLAEVPQEIALLGEGHRRRAIGCPPFRYGMSHDTADLTDGGRGHVDFSLAGFPMPGGGLPQIGGDRLFCELLAGNKSAPILML